MKTKLLRRLRKKYFSRYKILSDFNGKYFVRNVKDDYTHSSVYYSPEAARDAVLHYVRYHIELYVSKMKEKRTCKKQALQCKEINKYPY